MKDEVYKKYKLAGSIAANAREFGKELIKSGVSYLDLVNKIELKILNDGAGLAFPVNISINDIAAHFSAHSVRHAARKPERNMPRHGHRSQGNP